MTLATVSDAAFLAGRALFGGVLAFMGLNHFMNVESMAGYAEAKGIPAPTAAVVLSGLALVVGGLGVVLGLYPVVAAGVIVGFFVVVTPVMHDFWTVEDPQERQSEMTDFLKNAALAGGALALLAVGGAEWPLALSL